MNSFTNMKFSLEIFLVTFILLKFLVRVKTNYIDKTHNDRANDPASAGEDKWSDDVVPSILEKSKTRMKRDAELDYSYSEDSERSPKYWSKYYKDCGGKFQSPIDISATIASKYQLKNPLRTTNIEAKPLEIMAVHSGKTCMYYPLFCIILTIGKGPQTRFMALNGVEGHKLETLGLKRGLWP